MSTKTVPQTRAWSTSILTRRRSAENGSSPTGPKRDVVLAENARRSVMKQNQSATIAYAVTLSAWDMPTKPHGQRTEPQKHRRHYRRKSACLRPRYLHATQGVPSATKCIFHIASPPTIHIQNLTTATVLERDPLARRNKSVNHREFGPVSTNLKTMH